MGWKRFRQSWSQWVSWSRSTSTIIGSRSCQAPYVPTPVCVCLVGVRGSGRGYFCSCVLRVPTARVILRGFSQVCTFVMLKTLDVSNNSLVGLPEGLFNLENLEELNLAGNKLKELPKVCKFLPATCRCRPSNCCVPGFWQVYR